MFFYTFLPKLLNMSLTASVVIMFILLLRLLLQRAPKILSYALWGIVLFRLLCPFSLSWGFSLFSLGNTPVTENGALTSSIEYIPPDLVHQENPSLVLPVPGVGEIINETLPQGEEQLAADPMEAPMAIATYVWMAGVAGMVLYGAGSYVGLRRKLVTASHLRDNIYRCDEITSPFVLGLIRPKIYLPSSMSQEEQPYIILHEQCHIRRLDPVFKALAFAALCIHWFNPLVWAAFIVAARDMEMSCDEAVVKKMGDGVLADYAASLLSLATGRHIVAGMPLAFGEGDPKGRIRNLASLKNRRVWLVPLAVLLCAGAAAVLLTNPVAPGDHIVLADSDAFAHTNRLSYNVRLGKDIMGGTIQVEQWSGGTCVKSEPVTLTQGVDSIDVTMIERYQGSTAVGTDVQIETNEPDGDLQTYLAHPQGLNSVGWAFKGFEWNQTVNLAPSEEIILAAKVYDLGSGVQVFGSETLIAEPERLENADLMIVVRAVFSGEAPAS